MRWFARRTRGRPGTGAAGGSGGPPEGRAPVGGPPAGRASGGAGPAERAPLDGPSGAGDYEAWKRQVEAEARQRLKRGIKGVGERD